MNKEYVYLIAEELYLNANKHVLCNRNWLFAIYKALLVENEGDTEPIFWTKYNQWKIDHNCRAAKTKAKKNNTQIVTFNISIENENDAILQVVFKKNSAIIPAIKCHYKIGSFPNEMWEIKNPNNESILLSAFEKDQLFKSSIEWDANDEVETTIEVIEPTCEPSILYVPNERKKRMNDDQVRDMKFTALNVLLDQIRETYHHIEDENQKSYLQVVVGAAIFYLPCLNSHFNGFISINALKGYLKKERRVKDHIYPRKLAAKELLTKKFTLEELKERYHDHLAQFMYITSSENSILVNYYEEYENHDQAMEAFQIEKFPTVDAEKFSSHNELDKFLLYLNDKNVHNKSKEEIMELLTAFRTHLNI